MKELEALSGTELAGQLLVAGIAGTELERSVWTALRAGRLGGVILFRRNISSLMQIHTLCHDVAEAAPATLPPWISIDQEGGRVRRIRHGIVDMPAMRLLGREDNTELTFEAARLLGRQLHLLGFNLNFAPVSDVDSNPNNPVIGDRSFGSEPQRVVRHARAVMEGFHKEGLASCIKHYPGHGDTLLDSHLALPTVSADTLRLRQVELYPFERLAPSAPAAMTAHVVFPAFDSVPATFSPRLLTTLLKGEFGFRGVLFSDDLEMKALSDNFSIEDSAVRALRAGCDALLICSRWDWVERARTAIAQECDNDPAFRLRCLEALRTGLDLRRLYRPAKHTWQDTESRLWPSQSTDVRAQLKALASRADS